MTQRRTALFLSPHLDDVVFSCGGLAALLTDAGWHTIMATVFTRTIMPATGFALACQLDKGLPAEADYMGLRRQEDLDAAAIIGFGAVHWMDLPEAPHRGYASAPALFGDVLPDDAIAPEIVRALQEMQTTWEPSLVLGPQGLGNHVDHQLTLRAALQVFPPDHLAFYRDTPYAMRQPLARSLVTAPDCVVGIGAGLDRKVAAASAYVSQVGFQFGGVLQLGEALRGFAVAEGGGVAAERFCTESKQGLLF